MRDWLTEAVGEQYVGAILWTLGALAALVVLLLAVRLIRGMRGGTFVAGGRNRRARLAVLDAAAVDTHRRLVLVRRDDVEHLILIGGPTDVVVEQGIRAAGAPRRPAAREPAIEAETPAAPEFVEPQRVVDDPVLADMDEVAPAAVRPAQRPLPDARPSLEKRPAPAVAAAPRTTEFRAEPRAEPRPAQPRAEPARATPRPAEIRSSPLPPQRSAPPVPAPRDEIEEALLRELEVGFDPPPANSAQAPANSAPAPAPSLDDEMTRLLGELSGRRR